MTYLIFGLGVITGIGGTFAWIVFALRNSYDLGPWGGSE